MSSLHAYLDQPVIAQFPEIAVSGFLVADLDQVVFTFQDTTDHMAAARDILVGQGLSIENLSRDPRIAAWREAYAACGLKPSTFKSSPEQLGRRLLKGELVKTPLPLVNLYCGVSARWLAPLGAYDLDRLPSKEIHIRLGRPSSDVFQPLAGRAQEMPVSDRSVVYGCLDEVVCWGFNFRDSARTCLTASTRRGVFFSEAVSRAQHDGLVAALDELAGLLASAGARVGERRTICAQETEMVLDLA